MKLDKIKFAQVVAFIVDAMRTGFDDEAIRTLDNMIDIDVQPVELPGKANPADLGMLMKAIHEGRKIEAIKAYRNMTGCGLKEAKDAVEKDWPDYYKSNI